MFAPGKPFQPSLMFTGAYPSEASLRCFTRVGSWPYPQTLDSSTLHSSLFGKFVNYDRNFFNG
jgi:hypothetical protein